MSIGPGHINPKTIISTLGLEDAKQVSVDQGWGVVELLLYIRYVPPCDSMVMLQKQSLPFGGDCFCRTLRSGTDSNEAVEGLLGGRPHLF